MAIISAGYDGTVDEVQFASILHRYSVLGADDFKATTQAGDRIVSIADGTAYGPGTVDVATAIPNIQFAAATGTRWDLVVLRRDWQPPGGATSVTIIQGPATKGYPTIGTAATNWNRRPGVMDDQPIYLQEINDTNLGARIDLRCWAGHNGLVAASTDVLTYLDRIGAEVTVGSAKWTYGPGTNGVASWTTVDITQSSADVTTFGTGWSATAGAGHKPRVRRVGNMVHMVGAVTQSSAGLVTNILTVPAAFKPTDGSSTFVGSGVTSGGIAYELLLANGVLSIPAGYLAGSFTIGNIVPVTASWPIA